MPRMFLSAVVLAAVGIGLVAAATGGAQDLGQGPGRTFITYEKPDVESFRFVDAKPFTRMTSQGPRRFSAGDGFIVRSSSYSDPATTQKIATFRVYCLATNGARQFDRVTLLCRGTDSYADGTLTYTGVLRTGGSSAVSAVTGGTGAYEGASGQITSEASPTGPTKNTVHLITG
jgi:hypothetical protein